MSVIAVDDPSPLSSPPQEKTKQHTTKCTNTRLYVINPSLASYKRNAPPPFPASTPRPSQTPHNLSRLTIIADRDEDTRHTLPSNPANPIPRYGTVASCHHSPLPVLCPTPINTSDRRLKRTHSEVDGYQRSQTPWRSVDVKFLSYGLFGAKTRLWCGTDRVLANRAPLKNY